MSATGELDPVLDGREGPSKALVAAKDVVPLTKGGGTFAITRAVLVGTAGTLNIVTAAGNTRTDVPFLQGMVPIRIKELLAGGTASDVWGLY